MADAVSLGSDSDAHRQAFLAPGLSGIATLYGIQVGCTTAVVAYRQHALRCESPWPSRPSSTDDIADLGRDLYTCKRNK